MRRRLHFVVVSLLMAIASLALASVAYAVCQPVGIIETHVTSDSVGVNVGRKVNISETLTTTASASGGQVGIASVTESHTTTATVAISRALNAGNYGINCNDIQEIGIPFLNHTCYMPPTGIGENLSLRNFLLQSEAFDSSPTWVIHSGGINAGVDPGPVVVTPNATLAPNSTLTADKLAFPTTQSGGAYTSVSGIYQEVLFAPAQTFPVGKWTGSVYLKADAPSTISLFVSCQDDTTYSESYSPVNVTTSWQRFSLSFNSVNGYSLSSPVPQVACTGTNSFIFLELFSQEYPATTVYAWGAQMQQGAAAGSYVPTTTLPIFTQPDAITFAGVAHGASVTQNLTTSASVVCSHCAAVRITETHPTNDLISSGPVQNQSANPTETLTTVAIPSVKVGRLVVPTMTLTTNAVITVAKSTPGPNVTVSESLATSASVTALNIKSASAVEFLTTSDSVSVVRCGAVLESLTTSDSVSVVRAIHGAISETLTISDSVLATKTVIRGVSETLLHSDSVSRSLSASKGLTENLTTTDSVTGIRSVLANATVNLTTTDSVAANINEHAAVVENLTTSSAVTAVGPGQKIGTVSESLTTSDAARVTATHLVSVSENLTTTASVATPRSMFRSDSETLTTSASVNGSRQGIANIVENLTTTDVAFHNSTFGINVAMNLTESDSVSASSSQQVSVSELLVTSTSVGVVGPNVFNVDVTEVLFESDSVARVAPNHLLVSLSENLTTLSGVNTTSPGLVSLTESLTINDSVSVLLPLNHPNISESLIINDSVVVFGRSGTQRRRFLIIDSP